MEQITLSAERIISVFTRKLPGVGQQPLVCTEQGIQPLLGLDEVNLQGACSSIRLGPPLRLTTHSPEGGTAPYTWSTASGDSDGASRVPLYVVADAGDVGNGSLCFLSTCDAIWRLDPTGLMELVAGQPGCPGHHDGPGGSAQLRSSLVMSPDGTGGLFFSDGSREYVRRARLPALSHPSTSSMAATAIAPTPLPPALAVAVATMPFRIPEWSLVHALTYDYVANVLYVCTPSTIYHAVGVGTAAGTVAPGLEAVVGSEEGSGSLDGASRTARFGSICDAVVDSRGCLYVLDMEGPDGGAVVRKVDPAAGWAVKTLPLACLGNVDRAARLTILPGGWLCVYEWGGNKMWLMQMGLQPSQPVPPPAALLQPAAPPAEVLGAASAGPGPADLAEDFAAMLADPWHIADITIMIGGRAFHAHSQVLIARSEYFRRRLLQKGHNSIAAAAVGNGSDGDVSAPGGAPAAAPATICAVPDAAGRRVVPLPDADPEAFAQLLRYIYTGNMDFPKPLLRLVLELANRLLLPRVVASVQQQLKLSQQHLPPHLPPLPAAAAPSASTAPPDIAGGAAPPGSAGPGIVGGGGLPAGSPGATPSPVPGPHAAAGPPPTPAATPSAPMPAQVQTAPSPSGQVPSYGPTPTVPMTATPAPPPPAAEKDTDTAPSAPPADYGPPGARPQPQQSQGPQTFQPVQPQGMHSSQPQPQPQSQPYQSYPYAHHPGPAPPPPAFTPPPGAYNLPPQGYAVQLAGGPSQLYGAAMPPATFGALPTVSGYSPAQPPPLPYGTQGPPYPRPPGMYGAAPPPAGFGALPLPYQPQGYPSPMYGGTPLPLPLPPPQGGGYFPPPR
ncbi:hypothetical protein Vafri_1041 [Volvox africanus]|nr:hypothetical protein Vafri_1041 [Volvox africanus]